MEKVINIPNEEINNNQLIGLLCNHRLIPVDIDPVTQGYQCVDCGKYFEAYIQKENIVYN